MKVIEDNTVFPPRKYFDEVEIKFQNFTPKCRVLPANYFNEYNTFFTLKARYEPGENKYFPKGGFEIKHVGGGTYSYDLDQVVVHPFGLGMASYFSHAKNVVKEKVTGHGVPKAKRGRKPLDPEIKAQREAERAANKKPSTGKRGRPKKINK